jgi:tetratricopeptide (TPR) repeat protein
MQNDGHAAAAPSQQNGLNASNFDELERQVEEMFDKADNLMINVKNF